MRLLLLLLCVAAPGLAFAQQVPDPARPILRTILEQETAVPGQSMALTVTVLTPTWFTKPPVFPSFEVPNAMTRLPPRASSPVSERIGGETWSGVTRTYNLYPMISGRFQMAAQPIIITYADPETRKPVTLELWTDEVEFRGVRPTGTENLDPFIAARELTFVQEIKGEPENLDAGDAFTRTVKIQLEGTSPMVLPPLIPITEITGLRAYAKEPVVTETMENGILSGERVESVTYVAEASVQFAAPPIYLSWYNLATNKIETSNVDGFSILARGPVPKQPSFDWRTIAPRIIYFAAFLMLFAWAGIRLLPRINEWRVNRRKIYRASERYAFDQALLAMRRRNLSRTSQGVDAWLSRLGNAPVRMPEVLSDALSELGSICYGHSQKEPPLKAWAKAIQALRSARQSYLQEKRAELLKSSLPQLNPRGSI